MRLVKFLTSRLLIVALMIMVQIALYFSVWYYLQNRYIGISITIGVLEVILCLVILERDQSTAYKLPWIVVILLLPFAGICLFTLFGRVKLSRKLTYRFKDVYEVTQNAVKEPDVELKNSLAFGQSSYILNTCRLPAFNKCYNEYLPSGEVYFAKLEEELKKAEKYIFLEYFIIEKGKLWKRIHDILLDKVSNGIPVYLMYDDIGSITKVSRNFYKKLKAEGIHAVVFNRFIPVTSSIHNNRDHRKIAVIDGKVAFTGGVNIADEYTNEKTLFGKWKDNGIMIKGQAVDSFVALFLQNYNVMASRQLYIDDFIETNHEEYQEKGFVQPYGDGPRPIFNDYVGRDIYLNLINQAKKYLYITTPYLVVEYNIIEALANAAKRGVDVRIITPHIPDKKTIFIMTRSSYEPLLKAGVKIFEYKPGFIHAKTFISDDEYAVIGTVNLDYRSFVHHYECGVWMYKTKCICEMKKDFESIVKNDGLIMNEKNSKQNIFKKIIKSFLNLFAPLL